jgi:hypothetical protein
MPGDSKQTTQATSEPWKAAQPALKTALSGAQNLYKKGIGGEIFTGSTVIPWDQQTKKGMNFIQSGANANLAGKGLSGQYQDVINQGGYTDDQRRSADVLEGVMGGTGLTDGQQGVMEGLGKTIAGGGYNDALRSAQGGLQALASNPFNSYQQSALQNTQSTANSNFDVNANPAFQDVLRQAQGAARDSVNMSAGGAGRYGGGVHQGNLASEVGDLTSRMVGGEYQNWQNRRDAANSNLFNMGQTGIGTQMNANQGVAGIGQQAMGNMQNAQSNLFNMGQTGITNRTNAANSLYGMGQQALGNLGTAYTGMQQPANDLMKIGGMNEDLATRKMNDKLRVFNEKQNKPWDQLGRLNAIASGAGQMGGTQTQSQPGQNPFLSALGYGATGLGALGSFLGG